MDSIWRHLSGLLAHCGKHEGWFNALLRFAGGLTAYVFHRKHRELFGLGLFRDYVAAEGNGDVLAHLSHRHYLSRRFGYAQRIGCALSHYRYEDRHYSDCYKRAVYRDGGLALWSATVDNTHFSLRLVAGTELRHEGAISVVLMADKERLCEMSFAWVDAANFGAGAGVVPFVTRNQSVRCDAPALQKFRAAFPQNSPPYLCLAALHGIASAHGLERIAAIKHDSQIAFAAQYAQGFRKSYCDFWRSFGASELDHQAYSMPVPLELPALSTVKSKHRQRAAARRRFWAEVTRSASETIAIYRLQPAAHAGASPTGRFCASIASHWPTLMTLALSIEGL